MALGFILIATRAPRDNYVPEVIRYLRDPKSLDGIAAANNCRHPAQVVGAHPLFGEYDIIAEVEAPDFDSLGEYTNGVIRRIPGVIDTKTLTGIKGEHFEREEESKSKQSSASSSGPQQAPTLQQRL